MRTPCCLFVALLAGACATDAPEPAPPPLPLLYVPATPPPSSLAAGLEDLGIALQQQLDPVLWTDVIPTAASARQRLEASRAEGADAALVDAGLATAQAIEQWQSLREAESTAGAAAIIETLLPFEGRLPETSQLLIEMLFESGRPDEAAESLRLALTRWPDEVVLHEAARAWSDAHPDPTALVTALRSASSAQARATIAALEASRGRVLYDEGRLEEAAQAFDAAAAAATGAGEVLGDFEAAGARADALALAGWSRYYLAENEAGRGAAWVAEHLHHAEADFSAALEALPEHEQSVLGLGFLGNDLMDAGDLDAARDYFGRLARCFDRADWWNNHAFLCRETGTAADERGETARATELFESSYAAYEKAIALAPDDARMVNDTGLMLLYFLDRDLERAQALFEQARVLGEEVCANPFVEQGIHDENFLAYTDALHNLAVLAASQGQPDEARRRAAELLEVAPDRPDTRGLLEQLEALPPGGRPDPSELGLRRGL